MAESKNNVITHGLSGKVGDIIVFRQKNGRTFVSKAPEQPKNQSEKQIAHQRRFQRAVLYAKAATVAPETKDIYEAIATKKKRIAFNIAVADLLNAPKIEKIDMGNYSGQPGDIIRVEVSDDVLVKSVQISIVNSDGTLVEEGEAIAEASGLAWIYTATQTNDDLEGDKITITVTDLPENLTEQEYEL